MSDPVNERVPAEVGTRQDGHGASPPGAASPTPEPSGEAAAAAKPSAWSPFRHPVFRALWIATVVSNVGTWLNDVGAAWMMTLLTESPLLVALVQAATSLPMFLLALPAGAFSDLVDRRRYLLFVNVGMMLVAISLAALAYFDLVTPWVLLAHTFGLGAGAALLQPAWQATIPELVPRKELSAAVALNSVGINVSRAIGPALGGAVIAVAGPAAAFALNAVTFLGILWVLYRWERPARARSPLDEHFFGAMQAGIRYVRRSPMMRVVLVRSLAFFFFASALWALLPLVTRDELGQGATGYGVLLSAIGAGAVTGALFLPKVRARLAPNALVAVASLGWAGVTLVLALAGNFYVAIPAMLLGGASWIFVLASLNTAAQTAVPNWVRARALSVYLVAFFGAMAAGAALWGEVAARTDLPTALLVAAAGLVVGAASAFPFKLRNSEDVDLSPSMHWPAPVVAEEPDLDRGPVFVTLEYRIDPSEAEGFVRVMDELREIRRRDGAFQWGLYEDVADPGKYLEYFLVASWAAHLRQHEHVTEADRAVQERAHAFHRGDAPPVVSHYLAR